MNEFVKAFARFLHRDAAFILGGSTLLLSFLYAFGQLRIRNVSLIEALLGAGIAYVVGYVIQDSFVLLHLVRTKAGVRPNKLGAFLFQLYEREEPKYREFTRGEYESAKKTLLTKAPKTVWDDHERVEALKQIGTTLGPCLVVSAVLIILKPVLVKVSFDLAVASSLATVGIVLWFLGWLKVTQQSQHTLAGGELYRDQQAPVEASQVNLKPGH